MLSMGEADGKEEQATRLCMMCRRKKSGSARTRFKKSPRRDRERESLGRSSAHLQFSRPAARLRSVWLPTSSFRGRTTSAISIPPPQQLPSKWPLRKLLSALPRRTSPWAPRSARVRRYPEPANSATTRDNHGNRHAMQKLQKPGPLANNMSLQASSSSALPVSSPPSTTPSSTSPISRTSEQHPSKGLRI